MNRSKARESVKAFCSNNPSVIDIIDKCQLYPCDNWRKWTDHLSNYLIISNKISINSNAPSGDIIITDLFQNLHPKKILKRSQWALLVADKNHEFSFLFVLNDRLRLCVWNKGVWEKNYPPLTCSFEDLTTVLRLQNRMIKLDIFNFKGPIANSIRTAWAFSPNKILEFEKDLKGLDIYRDLIE